MSDRPRSPGIAYAVISIVLIVLVGVVALTARQPPPPTIAEFAPQAIENITDSPEDQSSSRGAGAGLGATPTPTPSPGETNAIQVPRVRKCIGDPPRQIEDPQSPPCVPYWQGDNGGATSKGVTPDEVRIATASAVGQTATETNSSTNVSREVTQAFQNFFNQRFEFYGRRLNLIVPGGAGNADAEPQQRAYAVAADEQLNVFASTAYRNAGGQFYHDELARRKVVSAMGYEVTLTHAELAAQAPYLWSYTMTSDRMFTNIGAWVCARLAGHNATHADPAYITQARTFGIILAPHPRQRYENRPTTNELKKALSACGVSAAFEANVDPGPNAYYPTDSATGAAHTQTMLRMREEGVNSIICLCSWQYLEDGGLPAASSQSYYPEWLVSSFGNMDHNVTAKLATSNQPQHARSMYGLSFNPKQVTLDNEPYVWALRDAGTDLGDDSREQQLLKTYANQEFYRSVLLIAAGVQMAGPRLTPETFARALHNTRFPNPDTPNKAGKVGFAGTSFSMTIDATEWWWGVAATSPYPGDSAGSICYVDGGARREFAKYPSGDVFFSGSCDSGR